MKRCNWKLPSDVSGALWRLRIADGRTMEDHAMRIMREYFKGQKNEKNKPKVDPKSSDKV